MSVKEFFEKNLGIILTILASAGVVGTSVLAIKGHDKATKKLGEAEKNNEILTTKKLIDIYAKSYALPVTVGAATIGCIIGSHFYEDRQKSLILNAAAPILASTKLLKKEEPREKEVKKVEPKVVKKLPFDLNEKVSWLDWTTLHQIEASYAEILRMENEIRNHLTIDGFLLMSTYCECFGSPMISTSYELGWEGGDITFEHEKMYTEDMVINVIYPSREPEIL